MYFDTLGNVFDTLGNVLVKVAMYVPISILISLVVEEVVEPSFNLNILVEKQSSQ
jgi:hypothetical protein